MKISRCRKIWKIPKSFPFPPRLQLLTTKWTGFLTRCLKRIILKKRENRLSFVLFAVQLIFNQHLFLRLLRFVFRNLVERKGGKGQVAVDGFFV